MRSSSYSSLQALASCERKYAYRYLLRLEKAGDTSLKFIRGHAFHAVVQADLLARGAEAGTLLVRPDKLEIFQGEDGLELLIDWAASGTYPQIFDAMGLGWVTLTAQSVIDHIKAWESQQEGERRDAMISEYGAPLHERMAELWERYSLKWAEESARQQVLLTEYTWEREAPNGQVLTGRIDSVVYDPETNLVIVRDVKTHDSWPSESDTVMDLMESQNHMNLWGVAPALRELSGAPAGRDNLYTPNALEFDRVRTKKPTTPKLTLKGQLSASVKDFDGWTYRQWCATEPTYEVKIKDPATKETHIEVHRYEYDPEVDAKADSDPDAWFRRSLKPLSMHTVTAHVVAAQKQAKRANELTFEESGLSPSKSCGWCDFKDVCRTELIGGPIDNPVWADYGLKVRPERNE